MSASPAVGVDDDLSARKAGVALRATHSERSSGIEKRLEAVSAQAGWDHMIEHLGGQEFPDFVDRDVRLMLPGEHGGIDPNGNALNVADSHLGLAVGFQHTAARNNQGARPLD